MPMASRSSDKSIADRTVNHSLRSMNGLMISTQRAPSPAQRPYTAYGAAAQLWASRAPEIVVSGPAGTGKSRACLEKLHYCALKYRGMRGLIIRKTRESLSEAALVTFEEKVLPEWSPIKEGPRRNFR